MLLQIQRLFWIQPPCAFPLEARQYIIGPNAACYGPSRCSSAHLPSFKQEESAGAEAGLGTEQDHRNLDRGVP